MNKYNLPEGIWNRIKNNYTGEDLDKLMKLFKIESKYKNKKIFIDGIKFDSIREGNRWCELKILERAGKISDIELQPIFIICPSVIWNGRKLAARKYIADFMYTENNKKVVEDSKGAITKIYSLKRSLFLTQYPQYIFRES